MLNRRFGEIARVDNPPFLGGGGGYQSLYSAWTSVRWSSPSIRAAWKRAIETAEQEQRRLVQYGVGQAELRPRDHRIPHRLQAAVAGAATRQPPGLATGLVGAVNDDDVFTAPADDLNCSTPPSRITVDEVNAAAAAAFEGQRSAGARHQPGRHRGRRGRRHRRARGLAPVAVTARVDVADVEWPYADFGTPTQPAPAPRSPIWASPSSPSPTASG